MNFDMLYLIILIVYAIGLVYGIRYLRRKDYIASEDLLFAAKVLDLSLKIIDELNLQKEKQIKTITQIVIDSLEFAVSISKNIEEIKENAYRYAIDLCLSFGIELTENRKEIIRQLIEIGLQNKYLDRINNN